jgi:transposase
VTVVGIDAHKRSHTLVAVDASGRELAHKLIGTTSAAHLQGIRWARRRYGSDLIWAVEDCRQVTRLLERDLLNAGYEVVRVPTRLMARTRASARAPGKSDPIDALAVARAALREPDLPSASLDESSRALKMLVDRREDLLGQRTATVNRLLWRLHELDPEWKLAPSALSHAVHRRSLAEWLDTRDGLVAELAREELADIARVSETANALEKRIEHRIKNVVPALLSIPGCGPLSAAKIVAETANVERFATEAAFASFAGVTPTPKWSGTSRNRMRYVKRGNRQINAALHRIALTQLRAGPGKAYYHARIAQGDSPMAALRCLKRRLARVVYTRMKADRAALSRTGVTPSAPCP